MAVVAWLKLIPNKEGIGTGLTGKRSDCVSEIVKAKIPECGLCAQSAPDFLECIIWKVLGGITCMGQNPRRFFCARKGCKECNRVCTQPSASDLRPSHRGSLIDGLESQRLPPADL